MKPSWQTFKNIFTREHKPEVVVIDMRDALPPEKKKQKWLTPKQVRAAWLGSFRISNNRLHQGPQEKARRVRQMANHTHGY